MKYILIMGGGTFNHVRCHLAISAPAFGETARTLTRRIEERLSVHNLEEQYRVHLALTKMADPISSTLITNDDVSSYLNSMLQLPSTCAVIFNVALTDFDGQIGDIPAGKYADRLQSRDGPFQINLTTANKLIADIKTVRPDVLLVGFKTTSGDTPESQLEKANRLKHQTQANIVLANDTVTRGNIIVTDHETSRVMYDRKNALRALTTEIVGALKYKDAK